MTGGRTVIFHPVLVGQLMLIVSVDGVVQDRVHSRQLPWGQLHPSVDVFGLEGDDETAHATTALAAE